MSFSLNLPPSVVAKKTKTEEQDEPKKKSREDWRKQKELEEMRKAGTAPAMTDEEGKWVKEQLFVNDFEKLLSTQLLGKYALLNIILFII